MVTQQQHQTQEGVSSLLHSPLDPFLPVRASPTNTGREVFAAKLETSSPPPLFSLAQTALTS